MWKVIIWTADSKVHVYQVLLQDLGLVAAEFASEMDRMKRHIHMYDQVATFVHLHTCRTNSSNLSG